MAKITISIITQSEDRKQEKKMEFAVSEDQKNWEEEYYQIGCCIARELSKEGLKALDDKLFSEHPEDWQSECFRKRTRVTRFGSFKVKRRLYKDKEGNNHFLLDEYLDWPSFQRATPSFIEPLLELACQAPFRQVVGALRKLVAGVLPRTTIHRILQEITGYVADSEKAQWEGCFQGAALPEPGRRKVPFLFVEADGLWVHLQREKQGHYELKNAIVYEGWELIGDERYELVNKRVYSHSDKSIPFWEGLSLMMDRYWDLSSVKLIVIGGDGADWVESGNTFQCVPGLWLSSFQGLWSWLEEQPIHI